jgi:hypothetical protein
MDKKELHAYLQGPDLQALTRWVRSNFPEIERVESVDLVEATGVDMRRFHCKHDLVTLENPVNYDWLELSIHPASPDSAFWEVDNLQLGEHLVDDLGGITLSDCGGLYTHPLSDFIVRVSAEKLELVYLPETMGEPFDETLTEFIKLRS